MTCVKVWVTDARLPRMVTVFLLLLLVGITMFPGVVAAFAGFGGYISEKTLGNGTDETLYLGDGTNELTVLGVGSIVSTVGAVSESSGNIVNMTMTGNLQSLNGMPQADVYFIWGYSPGNLSHTSTVSTVTTTGEKTAIVHPAAGSTVYYRFAASTDGTSYGAVRSLPVVGGGHGVSYWLLNTLLPIVVAAAILITVLLFTGNPLLAFIASVIGLMGFYIVLAIISIF